MGIKEVAHHPKFTADVPQPKEDRELRAIVATGHPYEALPEWASIFVRPFPSQARLTEESG